MVQQIYMQGLLHKKKKAVAFFSYCLVYNIILQLFKTFVKDCTTELSFFLHTLSLWKLTFFPDECFSNNQKS